MLNIGNLIYATGLDGSGTTLSTGNVGIGTTSPTYKLDVERTTDGVVASFVDNDNSCTIDPDTGVTCTSDIRLKKNIEALNLSGYGLDTVLALSGITYLPIDAAEDEKKILGFIAQDVETIIPELVTTFDDGYKGISYDRFSPILVQAIQDQYTLFQTQQQQVDYLNSQLTSINSQLSVNNLAIQQFGNDLSSLSSDLSSLNSELWTLNSTIASHSSEISTFNDSLSSLTASASANHLAIEQLNHSLSTGSLGIGVAAPATDSGRLIDTSSGAYLSSGGVWTNTSDVNLKENFVALDKDLVLDKIINLPVTRWNYKVEGSAACDSISNSTIGQFDNCVSHIGPTAQDFYSAFTTGGDSTRISTIDPAGVALVGIQALAGKIDQLQTNTQALQQSNNETMKQLLAQSFARNLEAELATNPTLRSTIYDLLGNTLASLRAEFTTMLQSNNEAMKQWNHDLQSQLAALQTRLGQLDQLGQLEISSPLATSSATTNDNRMTTNDSTSAFGDLLATHSTQLNSLTTSHQSLVATVSSFGDMLATQSATIASHSAQIADLDSQVASLSSQLDAKYDNRTKVLEARLAALEVQQAATQSSVIPSAVEGSSASDNSTIRQFDNLPNPTLSNEAIEQSDNETINLALPDSINLDQVNSLDSLSDNTASLSALLNFHSDLTSTAFGDFDGLYVKDFLAVAGSASIVRAEITDYLTIASNLLIDKNSISTLGNCSPDNLGQLDQLEIRNCTTLFIQSTGGSVNFLAGVMTIDDSGTTALKGDLTVSGKLVADSVDTNTIRTQTLVIGPGQVAGSAGQVAGVTSPNTNYPLPTTSSGFASISGPTATGSGILADSSSPTTNYPLPTTKSGFANLLEVRNNADQLVASIDATGSARFQKLLIASDNSPALNSTGFTSVTYTSNATTGTASMPAGKSSVIIQNPDIKANTLIYITPVGSTKNQVLYVKSKHGCDSPDSPDLPNSPKCVSSFEVSIDHSITSDIKFNWWIINQ